MIGTNAFGNWFVRWQREKTVVFTHEMCNYDMIDENLAFNLDFGRIHWEWASAINDRNRRWTGLINVRKHSQLLTDLFSCCRAVLCDEREGCIYWFGRSNRSILEGQQPQTDEQHWRKKVCQLREIQNSDTWIAYVSLVSGKTMDFFLDASLLITPLIKIVCCGRSDFPVTLFQAEITRWGCASIEFRLSSCSKRRGDITRTGYRIR